MIGCQATHIKSRVKKFRMYYQSSEFDLKKILFPKQIRFQQMNNSFSGKEITMLSHIFIVFLIVTDN